MIHLKPFEKFGSKPNAEHSMSGFAHTLLASKILEQKNYFSPTKKLVSTNQAKTPLFFKLIWLKDLCHGQKSPSF